ncbi:3-oxoacyl-[acyl-carrier-protein] synthase III C-terminal domain-containing protein [Streptomyces sp. NBC_00859]|uniref:3-oxoacyl-[acyl-carrier-protein] synthase III C-terminal domain-containing protein n=1 Tax=Streptomyces sp. NBC_00859 TaxID=2903682 RepID=UPI00386B7737|nr:hypothetical protein OG584_25660 [Streptomyces sp. NBC_00859]
MALVESVAGWAPPRRVTDDDLPAHGGVDDTWGRARTGIVARRRGGPGVSTGDLAHEAARPVVERAGELLGFDLGSDGTGHDLMTVVGGGSRTRASQKAAEPQDGCFRRRGRAVRRRAVERMTGSCRSLLAELRRDPGRADRFVGHQANGRIPSAVAEPLGTGPARCVTHPDRVGNTGAASIPPALADADARGTLRTGERVLLTAFGGGPTRGPAALRWGGPSAAPASSGSARSSASRTAAAREAATALSEELS